MENSNWNSEVFSRAGAVRHHEEFELRGTPIGGLPSYPVLQMLVRLRRAGGGEEPELELEGKRAGESKN
jgi:hypothetical protein